MVIPGVAHQTLAQMVATEVKKRVLDQTFAPGQRLGEAALAEEFGVSRVPVREALQELATSGLIERRPRRGFFVRETSTEELNDLISVSAALDQILFSRLASAMTQDALAEIEDLFSRTQEAIDAGNTGDAIGLNAEFHALARKHCGSSILQEIVERIETRLVWIVTQHDDPQQFLDVHREIVRAARSGNSDRLADAIAHHAMVSEKAALHHHSGQGH